MVSTRRISVTNLLFIFIFFSSYLPLAYAGGPLGIDHRLNYDDHGIWNRTVQKDLIVALFLGDLTGGLWEGGSSRPGKTYWQSLDAIVLGTATTQAMKYTFTRARPSQTDDPGKWFQGGSHYSFPSGEVAAVSAAITPFILEYGHDNPWVYGLEVLPAYDAAARMKVWGHWQSDVLVGFAVGTLSGYLAHNREQPFILNLLPDGASIGFQKSW